MNGNELADILTKNGITVKNYTRTSIVILVDGNRISAMEHVALMLKSFGAKIDRNLKGSSIGGILVGNVKILVKAAGRTGGLDVELKAIEDLANAISAALLVVGAPLSIRLKNRTVSGVTQVMKTPGTPKSDFHLADANGRPLIHISHKNGSTPRDFQQWGGVTEKRIADHPEIKAFADDCRKIYGDKMPNGESVYKKIHDRGLKMMSVFGINYDKGSTDPNRVDVLIQGDPGLRHIRDNLFEFTSTGHVHYHGEIPDGGFEPVLAMIYKGDRDQLGIRGARASIYPLSGRTFKRQIK